MLKIRLLFYRCVVFKDWSAAACFKQDTMVYTAAIICWDPLYVLKQHLKDTKKQNIKVI